MPRGATPKEERQYEHIKESYQKRGQKGRAAEIAARTVNKERSERGETKEQKARAHGERTRAQLYEEAKRRGVRGRSMMSKAQLERAVGR
jgi:hypothetical protein